MDSAKTTLVVIGVIDEVNRLKVIQARSRCQPMGAS